MTTLRFTAVITTLFVLGTAQAHETETCLMQVAQAATQLQECQVRQVAEGECDSAQQKLNRFVARCVEQQHPASFIERAMAYGRSEVAGDPAKSPYQHQLAKTRWQEAQTAANMALFLEVFPQFEAIRHQLLDSFGTSVCPDAYEGRAGRWLYLGDAVLLRYNLTDWEAQPKQRTLYYFAPEQSGHCYPAPTHDAGSLRIVNIPELVIKQIERQNSAIRCLSSDCSRDRDSLKTDYARYQAAYRDYRLLVDCIEIHRRNSRRASLKSFGGGAVSMPKECPQKDQKDMETALLNAKGLVESLDERLFERGSAFFHPANSLKD